MGSELMGQLIMAQLVDGVIVLPSWSTECGETSEWSVVKRDGTTTSPACPRSE
jgi:hypothetical protein